MFVPFIHNVVWGIVLIRFVLVFLANMEAVWVCVYCKLLTESVQLPANPTGERWHHLSRGLKFSDSQNWLDNVTCPACISVLMGVQNIVVPVYHLLL